MQSSHTTVKYLIVDRFCKPVPIISIVIILGITGGFGYIGKAYFSNDRVYALIQSLIDKSDEIMSILAQKCM